MPHTKKKKKPAFSRTDFSLLMKSGRCHMYVIIANTRCEEPYSDSAFLRRWQQGVHRVAAITEMSPILLRGQEEVKAQTNRFRCLFPQTAQTAGLLQRRSSETTT